MGALEGYSRPRTFRLSPQRKLLAPLRFRNAALVVHACAVNQFTSLFRLNVQDMCIFVVLGTRSKSQRKQRKPLNSAGTPTAQILRIEKMLKAARLLTAWTSTARVIGMVPFS